MKYEHICQDLIDRVNELEEKVERYEEALKYYTDEDNGLIAIKVLRGEKI